MKESPHQVVLTTQRFAPKGETSYPSAVLAPMGETLVVLQLLALMDASEAVLMLLLARKEETALGLRCCFATALPDKGGFGIPALLLLIEQTAMVPFLLLE